MTRLTSILPPVHFIFIQKEIPQEGCQSCGGCGSHLEHGRVCFGEDHQLMLWEHVLELGM